MREISIVGAGMTKFAKMPERDVIDLGREACIKAIKSSGVPRKDIQIAYCGTARTGQLLNRECGVGQTILLDIGISGIPVTSVGNFCASGSSALREAYLAIASGMYDVALAIGVEKLSVRKGKGLPLTSDGVTLLTALGFSPPAYFAEIATRHMYEFGTTEKQMALVTVKNRGHSRYNPNCQYQTSVTVEEVLASRPIVDPLRMLNCCPTTDGAGAILLCAKDLAWKYTDKPVDIIASSLHFGLYEKNKDMTTFNSDRASGKEAYEMAGLGPKDIDVAEVHDCFSIAEILHYEDLGFCPRGEGGPFVEQGKADIGGEVAINPSGGLLSRGHPLGGTGLAQTTEIFWQLRGEADKRQVPGARVGMTHTMGGFQDSIELADVASSCIHIYRQGW
ncbi:MAG: thiolase family protein [Deltaproteobacteria bacterium]|nr:thiolase family protein [Deltaproteobacteria bacterium]